METNRLTEKSERKIILLKKYNNKKQINFISCKFSVNDPLDNDQDRNISMKYYHYHIE